MFLCVFLLRSSFLPLSPLFFVCFFLSLLRSVEWSLSSSFSVVVAVAFARTSQEEEEEEAEADARLGNRME